MKILHALEEITDGEPRVFVLGFFDGCHLGHQAVFKEAAKLAEEKSAGIGVITFYPRPSSPVRRGKGRVLPEGRHGSGRIYPPDEGIPL